MAEHISLEAALAELAVDPIGVLRASGVKGKPRTCESCPVAEYIRHRLGVDYVSVVTSALTLSEKCRLPERVKQAIRAIDAGKHPELCR